MKPKIKSIHFREDFKGTRYIEVTFTDEECICITAIGTERILATLNCLDKYKKMIYSVSNACDSYLMGDDEETMSYAELAEAAICFRDYCYRPRIILDTELYKQAEHDFIDHISHFDDWDA